GYVFSGGTESGTVLSNGAVQEIFSGGTASGGSVLSGATQYDLGLASGIAINGGTEQVYASATALTVSNGGIVDIQAGGSAGGDGVGSNGVQYVQGHASGTVIANG